MLKEHYLVECTYKIPLPPFPLFKARTVGGPGTSTSYSKSDP